MSTSSLPKIDKDIASAVLNGCELKKVVTNEKNVLPSKEDVELEKKHVERIHEIECFNTDKLKSTPVKEKIVLPTCDDIENEKRHKQFTEGIEKFEIDRLKKTDVIEKNQLPSTNDIAREKTIQLASSFDHKNLKHVEPIVSNSVRVCQEDQSNQREQ